MTSQFLSVPSLTPELRVFISSTFLDMREEREHLVKKVFPEIRQICRERGVLFTEVDLRWGITEQQARRGRIVSTCLDEIALRKPYVLTLVGERYGWQPRGDDLGNSSGLLKRHPWIGQAIERGRSLVELESLEAGTHDPEMNDRVRFYFKAETDSSPLITAFRKRIDASGFPCRNGYRTPKRLGGWVREDILAILDQIAPQDHENTWLERERRGHEAFALSRRQAYIENPKALEKIDHHVGGEGSSLPLVITGESGSGKSALLAWWSDRFRRAYPEAFVISHHVGATGSSGDHIGLMRRVVGEIRERYGIREEPPVDPESLAREFPAWLARTQNEPLILLIDALNQLEGSEEEGTSLGWLPEHFPASVRLVVSTLSGPITETLRSRGWEFFRVVPLNKNDRRRVVREFLSQYGKEIETRQVRRIVDDQKTANPLLLRTSLEELRLSGQHDKVDDLITYYLDAADLSDLFQRILARLEGDFGAEFTESVMRLLWASRNGLSETELLGMLDCSRLRLTQLLHALEYHLMRRDGLLTFYHDHLRRGVEGRYLGLVRSRRAAHKKIARWFSEQPVSRRRAEEEPWGWRGAAKERELADSLSRPELLAEIVASEGHVSFFRYRNALPEKEWPGLIERITTEGLQHIKRKKIEPTERIRVARHLGLLMRDAAAHLEAEKLIAAAHALAREFHGPNDKSVASLLSQLGTILQAKGDYRAAEAAMRDGLAALEALNQPDTLEYADALDNLGSLLYALRDYKEAEPLFRKSLKIRRKKLGEEHPDTILSVGNIGACFDGRALYREARKYLQQALEQSKEVLGDLHPMTALTLNNLAASYRGDEQHEEAISLLKRALKINEEIYGHNHPEVASYCSNLGFFALAAGQHDDSEQHYFRALEIWKDLYGYWHPLVAQCFINIGSALLQQNRLDEAETAFRHSVTIRTACFGKNHASTHISWLNIARILFEKGNYQEALPIYERSLPMKIEFLGREHPDVLLSLSQFELAKSLSQIKY